jgi:transforming growth factor-beta-induced protein
MKTTISNFPIFILLVVSSFFVSCNDDDDSTEMVKNTTITDVAASNKDFSILVEALQKTGLDEALANKNSNFTVFAPTNAAFVSLLSELKVASLNDISKETLKSVLLYHVKSDKSISSQIKTGYYSTLADGPADGSKLSMLIDMSSGKINARSKIIQTDIMADNGVIHVIDKVLLPMSIADHAVANDATFSSLVAALSAAKLVPALNDNSKTYTVFAPTNKAFSDLLMKLGVGLNDLSAETLSPILLYHVINGYVPSSAVSASYVPTLSTAFDKNLSLQISTAGGVKLNNSVNVIATDVVATNGIIHVIDGVLLPQNVVELAQQNSIFSTLVLAVVKAELASALSKAGPYTVFAPTNDAFNTLFKELGVSGIDALSKEALTPILLAHVVSGNVQSGGLSSGMVPTLNTAKSLNVNVGGSGVTIDGSVKVVKADVQGSNGVIHVIDKVILP